MINFNMSIELNNSDFFSYFDENLSMLIAQ